MRRYSRVAGVASRVTKPSPLSRRVMGLDSPETGVGVGVGGGAGVGVGVGVGVGDGVGVGVAGSGVGVLGGGEGGVGIAASGAGVATIGVAGDVLPSLAGWQAPASTSAPSNPVRTA